jgi:hypothetical protein
VREQQPQPIPTRVTLAAHDQGSGPEFNVEYFDGAWKVEPIPYNALVRAIERAKGISIGVYEPGKHDGREVIWAGWV